MGKNEDLAFIEHRVKLIDLEVKKMKRVLDTLLIETNKLRIQMREMLIMQNQILEQNKRKPETKEETDDNRE